MFHTKIGVLLSPLTASLLLTVTLLGCNASAASSNAEAKGSSKATHKGIDVEPVLNAKKGQFRAVLIGVNNYERLKDLRFCEEDVKGLKDRLVEMGFQRDTIKCLTTGDPDPAYRPNHRNITERLDAMFTGLDKDSVLVIALSGHGGSFEFREQSGGELKESFYCPQDARLYDPRGTMISIKSIYDRLEKCPARFKMLLVDACRDPHIAPSDTKTAIDEAKSMARFAKSLSDGHLPKGTLALTSCTSGEQSYEDPELKHGIFMHYVLEGLAGQADATFRGDRNDVVSYNELKDYVYRKTSDHAWKKYDESQTPNFYVNWELPNFDLTRVLRREAPVFTKWPFDATEARRRQEETAKTIAQPVDFTNSIGMKFKLIPAGEFMMGSPEDEKDREDNEGLDNWWDAYPSVEPEDKKNHTSDEGPVHKVCITKPYYLGIHEVTQGEFEEVMGTSPWKEKDYVKEGSDYAASYVSRDDVVAFCKKLSSKEGREYRLPTEAEWEYACRAGSKTAYSFGDNSSNLDNYAWWGGVFGNGNCEDEKYAHRVGQKQPNIWGLYDMHGNVFEWCSDWYDEEYYGKSPAGDPTGPTGGSYRVYRGGSWYGSARGCRSASRLRITPDYRYDNLGFRIALVPSE